MMTNSWMISLVVMLVSIGMAESHGIDDDELEILFWAGLVSFILSGISLGCCICCMINRCFKKNESVKEKYQDNTSEELELVKPVNALSNLKSAISTRITDPPQALSLPPGA